MWKKKLDSLTKLVLTGQEGPITVLHFNYIQLHLKIKLTRRICYEKQKQATCRSKKIICSFSFYEMDQDYFWSKPGIYGLIGCRLQVSWQHHIYHLQRPGHIRHLCRPRGHLSHPRKKKRGRYLVRSCWTFSTTNYWLLKALLSESLKSPRNSPLLSVGSVSLSLSRTTVLSVCLSLCPCLGLWTYVSFGNQWPLNFIY